MRVLIVAATEAEIAPLAASAHARRGVDFLVTGVGMVATAARVSRSLALDSYDVAINLGLCGTFSPAIPPGAVVHVVSDRIAELGAEDGSAFLSLDDMGLPGDQVFTSVAQPQSATLALLPRVTAITVNTVHGHDRSIASVVDRFHPDVESMEGAAFMCACLVSQTLFVQVRAVSNVVERRNRASWKLAEAIDGLTRTADAILDEL
jgi:futalosine hydrolase